MEIDVADRNLIPAEGQQDRAGRRFALLAMLRLAGIAVAVVGMLIMAQKLGDLDGDTAARVGSLLVIFGALASLLGPVVVARRWKARDQL